jgi:hypothetical protein
VPRRYAVENSPSRLQSRSLHELCRLLNDVVELASIAVTTEAKQETVQRMSDELDEVITMFAETHAQTAELRRVLERTCRRAEAALTLAREIRRLRL